MSMPWFKNPLCVALDVDSADQALKLAHDLSPVAGGFKIGPRLIHRFGPQLVEQISKIAPVFVDCKFFDIPSTMVSAVEAAFDSGASVVTVHALSGREALEQLALLEAKYSKTRPVKILSVTILTSWDEGSLPLIIRQESILQHVNSLVDLVQKSGLDGIVCSPHELQSLQNRKLFKVTPGIRPSESAVGDQKRISTPQFAIKNGASALVVGRPIIESKNPLKSAESILEEILSPL